MNTLSIFQKTHDYIHLRTAAYIPNSHSGIFQDAQLSECARALTTLSNKRDKILTRYFPHTKKKLKKKWRNTKRPSTDSMNRNNLTRLCYACVLVGFLFDERETKCMWKYGRRKNASEKSRHVYHWNKKVVHHHWCSLKNGKHAINV